MFDDFLNALETAVESMKDQILGSASSFLGELESGAEAALEDLAGVALNAVVAQAPLLITGQEKFGGAVTAVVQAVEAGGKTVAVQTAQMAVQQAYLAAQQVAKTAAK